MIFPKHQIAQAYYEEMANGMYVIESGVDSTGLIYFHYANGEVKRFTRSQFIKIAVDQYRMMNEGKA